MTISVSLSVNMFPVNDGASIILSVNGTACANTPEEFMEFSGDLGLWQRKLTESHQGHARRMAVFDSLQIDPGQVVLDLGCGGGHLVRELALAVGKNGRVVGLDASAEQIEAARTLCSDLPVAELVEGDASNLFFDDDTFDGLACIQTLEYILDPDRALAESRRVLKPTAKAAFVSVCWDHWRFHGAEPVLNDRLHDAWRAHCAHQMLPLEMPRRLSAAGFGAITRRQIAFFNGTLHENTFAFWAAKVVATFAVGQGVAQEEADLWLHQLSQADTEGCFGFISVPVLTTAVAV